VEKLAAGKGRIDELLAVGKRWCLRRREKEWPIISTCIVNITVMT